MGKYKQKKKPSDWKSLIFNIYEDMVLFKGEDSTDTIVYIQYNPTSQKYDMRFSGNETTYHPFPQNIIKIKNPIRYDITEEKVFLDGKLLRNIKSLLKFDSKIGSMTRIIYEDGCYEVVDSGRLQIQENGLSNPTVRKRLNYYKGIACKDVDASDSENEKTIKEDLVNQLKKLTYIHPDSILYSYLTKGTIKKRTINFSNIIYPFNFNLSQKAALENALSYSVSVIQGPPGTGKTQTILNILANLVAVQHKSVAVVSNNNDAVDNVKKKLESAGYGFLVASLGNKGENQKIFFENMPEVPLLNGWNCKKGMDILCRENARLVTRLDELQHAYRDKKMKEQELLKWQTEQKHFEAYYSRSMSQEEEIPLPAFFKTPDRILTFLAENAAAQGAGKFSKLIYRLKWIFKYRIKERNVSKRKLLITLQRNFYILQVKKLVDEISMLEYRLEQNSFDDLLKEYQKLSEVLFKKYLYLSHNSLGKPDFDIDNYKLKYDEFIKRYPIVLSSTQSIRKSIPKDYLLDYVIIDESSQVDLIKGILAFSCCRNVIIVGDEKQLPQIVNTRIEKQFENNPIPSEYNYFRENIISSVRSLYKEKLPSTTLLEHYRCHPKIIEFCNQRYYDGKLIPCTNVDGTMEPLILYRTAKGNHMRKLTRGSEKGTYNAREIEVIEEIVNKLGIKEGADVGVVAPYKLQAKNAAKKLGPDFECDTVHKYQGREKEVIIMTTVLDDSRQGHSGIDFVDNPNLINVAVSRAQKQFILDTHHDLFFKNGKEINALIKYIQYNTPEKYIVESKVVSVFDLLYKEYSQKLLSLGEKLDSKAKIKSEEIIRVLLLEILQQEKYNMYDFKPQIYLFNLLFTGDKIEYQDDLLSKKEKKFVDNDSSLDFVVYDKMDKHCVLVIEVDGFEFHENRPKQLRRDRLKDSILKKYNVNLLRLKTNESGEREKIENALDVIKRCEELEGKKI